MYALDGANGDVLWTLISGYSCNSGAAIANGKVYWTTGYSAFTGAPPVGSVKFYVFGLPD